MCRKETFLEPEIPVVRKDGPAVTKYKTVLSRILLLFNHCIHAFVNAPTSSMKYFFEFWVMISPSCSDDTGL
jgi:hypothetical protein